MIGVMQGRLLPPVWKGKLQSFPHGMWKQEFPLVKIARLDYIEWIYEDYKKADNPIVSPDTIYDMRELQKNHTVAIPALCADYFMVNKLVHVSNEQVDRNLERLYWLIGQCHYCGINRIVMPFLGDASIITEEDMVAVAGMLNEEVLSYADFFGVEISLETNLPPPMFSDFLRLLAKTDLFTVTYDTGNSCFHGYNMIEEWRAYGRRIAHVHLKDSTRASASVPLGHGQVDWGAFFRVAGQYRYHGDFTIQAAREEDGKEVELIDRYRKFVEAFLVSIK